jgi:hypothetical protein
MNVQFSRPTLEEFGRIIVEEEGRRERARQSQRGYIDENGVLQGGLMAFIRHFWLGDIPRVLFFRAMNAVLTRRSPFALQKESTV